MILRETDDEQIPHVVWYENPSNGINEKVNLDCPFLEEGIEHEEMNSCNYATKFKTFQGFFGTLGIWEESSWTNYEVGNTKCSSNHV